MFVDIFHTEKKILITTQKTTRPYVFLNCLQVIFKIINMQTIVKLNPSTNGLTNFFQTIKILHVLNYSLIEGCSQNVGGS